MVAINRHIHLTTTRTTSILLAAALARYARCTHYLLFYAFTPPTCLPPPPLFCHHPFSPCLLTLYTFLLCHARHFSPPYHAAACRASLPFSNLLSWCLLHLACRCCWRISHFIVHGWTAQWTAAHAWTHGPVPWVAHGTLHGLTVLAASLKHLLLCHVFLMCASSSNSLTATTSHHHPQLLVALHTM